MIKNRRKVRVGQTVWMSVNSTDGRSLYKPSAHIVEKVEHHHIYFKEIGTTRKFFIHKHYLAEALNRNYVRGVSGIFTTYRRCLANCKKLFDDLESDFKNMKWVEGSDGFYFPKERRND